MLQLPLNIQLDDSAQFSNFVEADNRQVCARLKSIQLTPEDFVYVWGATDSGKTHLAQAVCHQQNQHNKLVAYLPLDNPNLLPQVCDGMSVMDLVCIDNLDAVLGDHRWEVALFDLYNNLKAENKSLLVFSKTPPSMLHAKLADLKSRLSAMVVYRLEGLSDQQKLMLLQVRASNRGLEIPPEVAQFILSRYSRSVKDLIQILEKLDSSSIALKRRVTIPFVKQLFD